MKFYQNNIYVFTEENEKNLLKDIIQHFCDCDLSELSSDELNTLESIKERMGMI